MRDGQLHLYWATGCTRCLRVKEFLERNDVDFVEYNVAEDRTGLEEIGELGSPQHVPIVRRGDEWADGKVLEEVGEIVGIECAAEPLPVAELRDPPRADAGCRPPPAGTAPGGGAGDDDSGTIADLRQSRLSRLQHPRILPGTGGWCSVHESPGGARVGPPLERRAVGVRTKRPPFVGLVFEYWGEPRLVDAVRRVLGEPTMHEFLERTT